MNFMSPRINRVLVSGVDSKVIPVNQYMRNTIVQIGVSGTATWRVRWTAANVMRGETPVWADPPSGEATGTGTGVVTFSSPVRALLIEITAGDGAITAYIGQQAKGGFGESEASFVAAPWVSITKTHSATTATSHSFNLPAMVNAGDLLVAVTSASNSEASGFAGWTQHASNLIGAPGHPRVSIHSLIATGTEGGGSVAFTTGSACGPATFVFRFEAGTFDASDPVLVSTATGSTSDTHSPPNLAFPWGQGGTFAMALLATESDILIEGFLEYPYADYQDVSTSTGGTGYTSLATAGVLEQNATAEPGDFITGARNRDSTSITVAIKPANSP